MHGGVAAGVAVEWTPEAARIVIGDQGSPESTATGGLRKVLADAYPEFGHVTPAVGPHRPTAPSPVGDKAATVQPAPDLPATPESLVNLAPIPLEDVQGKANDMTPARCSCGFTELADETIADHLQQVFEPADRSGNDYRHGGAITSYDQLAWLTLTLGMPEVRDAAWLRMDPVHRAAHQRLWTTLTRLAPPGHVAAPAALLALDAGRLVMVR